MAKTRAPSIPGEEISLLCGALLPDGVPPAASPTAVKRSATTTVTTTAGTTGAAAAYSAAATSTLAAAPAAATALGVPATSFTTSSRTTPAAAFTRGKRLLGWPGRPLPPLLLGQGGLPHADDADDLGLVAILHGLQRCLGMVILIRQRANKTRVQEGVRDSQPLLSHLVVRIF